MKYYICLCAVLLLSACMNSKPLAQMGFNNVKPYPVYVASYDPVAFINTNMNLLPEGFVVDPSDIVNGYLKSRFEPVGGHGKLRIIIKGVSVQHELIKSDNMFGAALGIDHHDHYTIRIGVVLQALGLANYERQETLLTAHRSIYISEHVSLADRENAQMIALDTLIDELDISIRKVLKDQFSIID